jgi:hypothetical protein
MKETLREFIRNSSDAGINQDFRKLGKIRIGYFRLIPAMEKAYRLLKAERIHRGII